MSILQLSRLVEKSATLDSHTISTSTNRGSNTELQDLTNRLVESSKAHGMEISQEKNKSMVNSKNNDKCAKIYMVGILLEDVKIFKYLGATLKSDGASGNELRIRIATYCYICNDKIKHYMDQ